VTLYSFTQDSLGRLTQITDRDGRLTQIQRNIIGQATQITSPFGAETTLTVTGAVLTEVVDPAGQSMTMQYAGVLLTSVTDANGGAHTFTYDAEARLTSDADPADGAHALTRTEQANGWTVTRTQNDAGVTSYITERPAEGGLRRTVVAPDDTATVQVDDGQSTIVTVQAS